jgi:tRNA(Ile)-lysidine synthase
MSKSPAVIAVAVSGGRDSMALLHCTAGQAAESGLHVVALHVHHGLMPEAEAWARRVQRTCERWAQKGMPLSFAMTRLQGKPARGQSVEAWARHERYAALADMARMAGASMVLLAHHQDDQAETFLLQALRGAGPAGLAAMPSVIERDGLTWARPWLSVPGDAVTAYARKHRVPFVQDPSNADSQFARSRLRQQTMPLLRKVFPDAATALHAAAAACAQAQSILDEVRNADWAACADTNTLRATTLKALSPARGAAVVLAWLQQQSGHAQRNSVLAVLALLQQARSGSVADVAGGQVRLYRARLSFAADASAAQALPLSTVAANITGAGVFDAPGGRVSVRRANRHEAGLTMDQLTNARWSVRHGGEQFQRAANTPARSLKKAYQAAAVPAWQRNTPLLVDEHGSLLFVPGLGLDARQTSADGKQRWVLAWQALSA